MENKSNSVDTFIKFILAGKAASHQLQLFTSKPKSKLSTAALCSFTSHTTTALAVKALSIKLQNISTCRHRILHNIDLDELSPVEFLTSDEESVDNDNLIEMSIRNGLPW